MYIYMTLYMLCACWLTGLNRTDLVSVALLLGCDYCPQGLPGVGKEGAMKLIRECKSCDKSCDMLDTMRGWRDCTRSKKMLKIETQVQRYTFTHCVIHFVDVRASCVSHCLSGNEYRIGNLSRTLLCCCPILCTVGCQFLPHSYFGQHKGANSIMLDCMLACAHAQMLLLLLWACCHHWMSDTVRLHGSLLSCFHNAILDWMELVIRLHVPLFWAIATVIAWPSLSVLFLGLLPFCHHLLFSIVAILSALHCYLNAQNIWLPVQYDLGSTPKD